MCCLFLFSDRVLHCIVPLRSVDCFIYSWRHVTRRLEGHSVLYPAGLGAIEKAKSKYL